MNTQEKETLTRLLTQLGSAKLEQKDTEAESLIRDACNRQPDASYLLVQRILLLEKAFQEAQARVSTLQSELDQARPAPRTGFLEANSWGNAPATVGMPTRNPAQFVNPPPVASPPVAQSPAWGSGILGSVATTAAGVVAGSFLFQGIEHLMGNHGSNGFASGGGHQGGATENTVINNYYGTDSGNGVDSTALDDSDAPTESDSWV